MASSASPLGVGSLRRGAVGLDWRAVLGIWTLIMALLLVIVGSAIPDLRMGDPDDVLRLVQVRDLLAGQGWYDLHQYRVMAPAGVAMHWSRLVDLPIAATILVLRPLLGASGAEIAAALIVPALTLLAALILVMRTAQRLFDRETALVAGIVTGLAGPMLHQMQPLRLDHHGWQIVAALGAMAALHARDPRKAGWAMGLSLAAGLTISLEGLPLAVLFLGALALRSLRTGCWDWLVQAALALVLSAGAMFLAFRGLGDLAEHCDSLSPMHLAALAWVAAGCLGLGIWRPRAPLMALAGLAVLGIGATVIVAGAAPQCVGGAFGDMDPFVKSHWLDHVREGLPVWTNSARDMAALISVVPLGLWACWRLLNAETGPERVRWLEHGLVLLGAALVGALVSRAMATAEALAIVPAAWQLRQWRLRAIGQATAARRMGLNLLLLVVTLPVVPVAAAQLAWSKASGTPIARKENALGSLNGCDFIHGLVPLEAMAPTDIFAPVDIGPEILLRTRQRVVATGHHRAGAAIGDVVRGFLADPEQARTYIEKRHATLVVTCTVAPEMALYRAQAPGGLAAALLEGHPPSWLRPIAPPRVADKPTRIAIWQVVPRPQTGR